MNEIRTLLEKNWVCKEKEKELYYKVKRDIPLFQQFVREQLGWKLIHTEHIIKLEKIPAYAESFMGIQKFIDTRDYCILCVILMYLEDKAEQEQFLLSELIDYVGTKLKSYMEIDWTSFTQRKSLVRVLQYMEELEMLRVYDGNSNLFGQELGQEVLYENTGYSKYFATTFSYDISKIKSYVDFENSYEDEIETNRGHIRVNRVYRQLLTSPAMYWENSEDPDSLYLKTQRQRVENNLDIQIGGRLDMHKNMACWLVDETDCYGKVHPRDAMLPEIVLLVCSNIKQACKEGKFKISDNQCIYTSKQELEELILNCSKQNKNGWSKEYREMIEERLIKIVIEYMKSWLMIKEMDQKICIYPSVGKTAGYYPVDFKGVEQVDE